MSFKDDSDEDDNQPLSTHFRTKVLTTDEERMEAFKLRHQVYTLEQPGGQSDFDPDAFERDEHDERAIIIAAFARRDDRIAGTIRLIKRGETPLPIETTCPTPLSAPPIPESAEFSRMAVSKFFRRRIHDGKYGFDTGGDRRDPRPVILLSLFRELYRESRRQEIDRLYAIMETPLARMFKDIGIEFEKLAPEFDYMGPVVAYGTDIQIMVKVLRQKNPSLMREFHLEDLQS